MNCKRGSSRAGLLQPRDVALPGARRPPLQVHADWGIRLRLRGRRVGTSAAQSDLRNRGASMSRSETPRTVLPIPQTQHVGLVTYDAKDAETSFAPIEPLRPPAGAPNVLVVMLDDAGFGSSSAFGG